MKLFNEAVATSLETDRVKWNLSDSSLYEEAIRHLEAGVHARHSVNLQAFLELQATVSRSAWEVEHEIQKSQFSAIFAPIDNGPDEIHRSGLFGFAGDLRGKLVAENERRRTLLRWYKRFLKFLATEIHRILRTQLAIDSFLKKIVLHEIPWYLLHGCHPPAALPSVIATTPGSL